MNKFRIVEQRGVFRIQEELTLSIPRLWWIGHYDRKSFCFISQFSEKEGDEWGEYSIVERDTYKKAENYIKKFYGSTGVDAIEKPEWKTV